MDPAQVDVEVNMKAEMSVIQVEDLNQHGNEQIVPSLEEQRTTLDAQVALADEARITGTRARTTGETFLQYWARMLKDLDPKFHAIMTVLLGKTMFDLMMNLGVKPFEDVCRPSNTSETLLSFSDAFVKSVPDITQMSMFMIIWAALLVLNFKPLRSKMLVVTTVLSAVPLYYFPALLAKAPNFSVSCGAFETPIFWFSFFWALGFSLFYGFMILVVSFISWKHVTFDI